MRTRFTTCILRCGADGGGDGGNVGGTVDDDDGPRLVHMKRNADKRNRIKRQSERGCKKTCEIYYKVWLASECVNLNEKETTNRDLQRNVYRLKHFARQIVAV